MMAFAREIEQAGFAVLPDFFPFASIDALLQDIAQISVRRSRAGIRHALSLPPVASLAHTSEMIGLAAEVLGMSAFPFRATLFDKSIHSNWLVVWHQDTALPLRMRLDLPEWGPWSVKEGIPYAHAPAAALEQVLALRVNLDDSFASNGPLRVLPGTHTFGVLSDDAIHELGTRVAPVDCVGARGSVIAMRPLVVHSSSKSQTADPRRVLHIEYAASQSIARPLELAIV